jgi:hypothetical protein
MGVAFLSFLEVGAKLATVGNTGLYRASAAVVVGSAGLGASTPIGKSSQDAINWARLTIAMALLRQGRASITTVLGMRADGSGAAVDSSAARQRARTPSRPLAD